MRDEDGVVMRENGGVGVLKEEKMVYEMILWGMIEGLWGEWMKEMR